MVLCTPYCSTVNEAKNGGKSCQYNEMFFASGPQQLMNSKQSDYASLSEYALPSAYQDTILVKETLNGLQCEPIPNELKNWIR